MLAAEILNVEGRGLAECDHVEGLGLRQEGNKLG